MKAEQSSVVSVDFRLWTTQFMSCVATERCAFEEQTMNRIFKKGRWRSNGDL
jgi:hypothetical protein